MADRMVIVRDGSGFAAAWQGGPAVPLHAAVLANGQAVVIRIRPEHLLVAADGIVGRDGQVSEPLGSETLVIARFGGRELTAKCDGRVVPRAGERLRFALDLEHLHVFDRDSGQALRRVPPA